MAVPMPVGKAPGPRHGHAAAPVASRFWSWLSPAACGHTRGPHWTGAVV